MIWLICFVGYFVGFFISSRLVYRVIGGDELDEGERVFDTLIISVFWPIFVVGYYLYKWWTWKSKEA